jgi:dolichol-phosphate mannosyltransferase
MISVVVPVLNEAANVERLAEELVLAAERAPIREIVYVDDGSDDDTVAILRRLRETCPALRVVRHPRRLGQSAAMLSGARAATQDVLAFLDGDGQNDPADIVELFEVYRRECLRNVRIAVLGERRRRFDSPVRRFSSRLANAVRRRVLGDATRDTGCSLKLVRREDYLALPYFDHMHRFLPALLMREGVVLRHVEVSHRPRVAGASKYGFRNRALVGMVDLVGVAWLMRRRLPPDGVAVEVLGATGR